MKFKTIGLISPNDSYHASTVYNLIGEKVEILNGEYWSDGWWHGNVKHDDNTISTFYKVRFLGDV